MSTGSFEDGLCGIVVDFSLSSFGSVEAPYSKGILLFTVIVDRLDVLWYVTQGYFGSAVFTFRSRVFSYILQVLWSLGFCQGSLGKYHAQCPPCSERGFFIYRFL